LVRLISTENEKQNCNVTIRGLGVKVRRLYPNRVLLRPMAALLIPLLLTLIINFLPGNVLSQMGMYREVVDSKEVVKLPNSLGILYTIILLMPFFIFLALDFKRMNRVRTNKRSDNVFRPPDWDL